jgi:putative SOS response-associated peptidase YedK
MCGRFVQTTSAQRLATLFGAVDTTGDALRPRHNVAPSTPVPAVIRGDERRLGLLRWGFVPPWARDPDSGPRPINARSEGAAASRLFAPSLGRRRAVVPVDAWYEWTDEDGARQPWLIRPAVDAPASVAALWSTWRASDAGPDAAPLGTVALLTTEAEGEAATVHHRMPLTVPDDLLEDWLDPSVQDGAILIGALRAVVPQVTVTRVSRRVNDVRNDGPELLEPVEA